MIQRTHWNTGDELRGVDLEDAFLAVEAAIGEVTPVDGGGAGGATGQSQTATLTSSVLAPSAIDATRNAKLARVFTLSKITTSRAAWVRIYATPADRTADYFRGQNDDPAEGVTLALEFRTAANRLTILSPSVLVSDAQTTNLGLPATIINLDGAPGTVAIAFDYLPLQNY